MKTLLSLCLSCLLMACSHSPRPADLSQGKQLSFQRDKGNCLACHAIEEGEDPGNIGPPLVNIQAHFSSKTALKAIIWDATQFNPQTSMPPFGKNKILSPEELEQVVDYIWSLN